MAADKLEELLTLCEVCYYNHLRAMSLREESRPGFDEQFVADCKQQSEQARTRLRAYVSGVKASGEASAWWALVMGAAASIEDAANCLRDPDAKKQADGAAKHYREAAQLMAAAGVTPSRYTTACTKDPDGS